MTDKSNFPTLADTDSISHFMRTFGQPVYDVVQDNPPEEDRILRGRLVLEEAFELVEAMGLLVSMGPLEAPRRVNPKSVTLHIDQDSKYDPVETADALADLIVVVKGAGHQLGLPVDQIVLNEVYTSNMSKLEDGKVLKDAGGKILKGKGFFSPDIKKVLDSYPHE